MRLSFDANLLQFFKDRPLPSTEHDALSSQENLINRAIAMHLLREGQFSVAGTFLSELSEKKAADPSYKPHPDKLSTLADLEEVPPDEVRKQFATMYYILHELKDNYNLLPAINWSRENQEALRARGSNLEFELCRLQFVWLFHGGEAHQVNSPANRQAALEYARREFHVFMPRYLRDIQQLVGAMAFCPNLQGSPYRGIFNNSSAWDDVAHSFTREFCSLLGLSADSPLYIAATAGAIALPTLLKLQTIMKAKRTEWTTQDELPVSTPQSDNARAATDNTGRNSPPAIIPLPLNLRLSRLEGTVDGPESPDDDALRTRHRGGITQTARKRQSVQVSVLSEREPSARRQEGIPVS